MRNYLNLVEMVLRKGETRADRTGAGTRSLFGARLSFDLTKGFPATTAKRLAFRQVAAELTCFLRAYTTLEQFHSVGCAIWDGNGLAPWWVAKCASWDAPGYLGPIYGAAWRQWPTPRGEVDQLRGALDTLKADPWSRRAVVTAWNPATLDDVCLPPCHAMFQLSVRMRQARAELDCAVFMRSVDLLLGMPFDVASYALLTHICSRELGTAAGRLEMFCGDAHVYLNHVAAAEEMLSREPRGLPVLSLSPAAGVDSFGPDMASLAGYLPHPPIRAELNV